MRHLVLAGLVLGSVGVHAQGWERTDRYWELRVDEVVQDVVRIEPSVAPGDRLAWIGNFDGTGEPVNFVELIYLGVDASGIGIERREALTDEGLRQGYREVNPIIRFRSLEFASSLTVLGAPDAAVRTLRLPRPPTSFSLGIAGTKFDVTLTLQGTTLLAEADPH